MFIEDFFETNAVRPPELVNDVAGQASGQKLQVLDTSRAPTSLSTHLATFLLIHPSVT